MVFQDPMSSLNPVIRIGEQIAEQIRVHEGASKDEARKRTIEALTEVGIPRAAERIDSYPHEFSGGMRQRVMIANGAGVRAGAAHRRRADHRARP